MSSPQPPVETAVPSASRARLASVRRVAAFDSASGVTSDSSTTTTSDTNTGDGDLDQQFYDIFAAALMTDQFRDAATNIATADLNARGVKAAGLPVKSGSSSSSSPADAQNGLIGSLIPLLGGLLSIQANAVQNSIAANGIAANGIASNAVLPDAVQQGIFDGIAKFVSNPIFTNVVTGIVKEVVPPLINKV